jgi:hypothetical protein
LEIFFGHPTSSGGVKSIFFTSKIGKLSFLDDSWLTGRVKKLKTKIDGLNVLGYRMQKTVSGYL